MRRWRGMAGMLCCLGLFGVLPAQADRSAYASCYAEWDEARVTVGNARFERTWDVRGGGLTPTGFRLKAPDSEWLVAPTFKRSPGTNLLSVSAATGRWSAVGAEGLRVDVSVTGGTAQRMTVWVFPDADGALVERADGAAAQAEAGPASGIEVEPPNGAASQTREDGETLVWVPPHVRVTQVTLMDQTDRHNELVSSREWLLAPSEARVELQGCVLFLEDTLTGSGLAFLKLSPLPHARPDPAAVDFSVDARARSLTTRFGGYPVATLGYRGGGPGRTRALHALQRCLRAYRPERDGLFLSNTWGDRSRDARINEAFLLKEIEAGAALGVDIVQIDDGWQKGRSANSASARGKGAWNGYWAADPAFWTADPVRFPNGLEKVVQAARENGMAFGLWFGPDSSDDAANWQKDADCLLAFYQKTGIAYFKLDSMKTHNARSLQRQRAMFDRMQEGSGGAMTFDLDVTAEIRPGYFGLPDVGPLFVENRYTDFHNYWPHQTLRNLWMLSQVVDPVRLRIEVLNNTRNREKYSNDPLAPACYQADTLFAIAMTASPLGWFETSNLSADYVARMRPLVAAWKIERARMHGGATVPVGAPPDGMAWTGFVTAAERGGYALVFRELNASSDWTLDLTGLVSDVSRASVLGGHGTACVADGKLTVHVPQPLDFIWVRLE